MPSPSPLRAPYEVIAAQVRKQIAAANFSRATKLPTVAELAITHTVSVGTAHRDVALLRDECPVDVTRRRRAVVQGVGGAPAKD